MAGLVGSLTHLEVEAKEQREKSLIELVTNMRSTQAAYVQHLSSMQALSMQLQLHEVQLTQSLNRSEDSAEKLSRFQEEMRAASSLERHRKQWQVMLDAFQAQSLGNPAKGVEPISVAEIAEKLCQTLALAEPEVRPAATAVVMWHPENPGRLLKVLSASEASEFRTGETIDPHKAKRGIQSQASGHTALDDIWMVMRNPRHLPMLVNPYGLPEAMTKRSVVPLLSTNKKCFGAVVSGPPAMPDGLLEPTAITAGWLMERSWRTERALQAIDSVSSFVKSSSRYANKLVYMSFKRHETVDSTRESWEWQPFQYRDSKNPRKFVATLGWAGQASMGTVAQPIGVLTLELGTFTEWDEHLLLLWQGSVHLVKEAIAKIEKIDVGYPAPLATVAMVVSAETELRSRMPKILQSQICHQLTLFDSRPVFAELVAMMKHAKSKVQQQPAIFAVMRSFLILLGYSPKSLSKWEKVASTVKKYVEVVEKMKAFTESEALLRTSHASKEKGKATKKKSAAEIPWDASAAACQGWTHKELEAHLSFPVLLLSRWISAVSQVHTIAIACMEDEEPEDHIAADALFNQLDEDNSGSIDMKELMAHLFLTERMSTEQVHALVRSLDASGDGRVSRQEFRRRAGPIIHKPGTEAQPAALSPPPKPTEAPSRYNVRRLSLGQGQLEDAFQGTRSRTSCSSIHD